jgi:hypothetical protein
MDKTKHEVVTFKADEALLDALRGVRNRSEFIRDAILVALENTCPLCQGSGILSPASKEHWDRFMQNHQIKECDECKERYIECN